ncbi:NAD(P)H-binding protein [Helicobacter sp. T3_23-1056]
MKKILTALFSVFACLLNCACAVSWQKSDFIDIKGRESKAQILIIGANGSVAKVATQGFLVGTNANLKLFLRDSGRLSSIAKANPSKITLIEGDALDIDALKNAMKNVNVVYANLAGSDIKQMAQTIITAMKETGLKRLIWIGSYGVYDSENVSHRSRHAEPIRLIESSGLDYTIIRPQWFSNADEIDYELTRKGEVFKNPSAYISRKSIAHLVIRLCVEPNFGIKESFGINKPAK